MLWKAKDLTIPLAEHVMYCAAFGRGARTLVLLPGLGDGLKNVRGMALPLAWLYRAFARDFRVLVLSRKEPALPGSTTRDMAADVAAALGVLGVEQASVVGVSMGGMIAQHLAADYPGLVEKLVLAVTCPGPTPLMSENIARWMDLARRGDHVGLMVDNGRQIYSDAYLRRLGWAFPVAGRLSKPRSYEKFLILAAACAGHDAADGLARIAAPTLIVGGQLDKTLGPEGSYALHRAIGGSRLKIYPHLGHSAYEEAPDFQQLVLDFLQE